MMRANRGARRSGRSAGRLVVLSTLLITTASLAHGVAPQTTGAASSPWVDGGVLVTTSFGLLVTADRCTWQLVCTQHLGFGDREVPTWHAAPTGTLFAAALSGLAISRDRGCTFTRQPFFDATGVAQLTSSTSGLWAVTGKFGVTNGLARSTDDGATFAWTAARAPKDFFTSVRTAPSRPERLYLSSWYFDPPSATLWVSDDGAASFSTVDVGPRAPAGSVFTVHAVDASNADVVYASLTDTSKTPERSTVLRSADRGQTFTTVLEADGSVSSVAQSTAQWLIAVGDRVFSSVDGIAFSPLASPTQRACVNEVGGEMLVCGRQPLDPFSLGRLEGTKVVPVLEWAAISGPVECAASTPGAACRTAWPVEEAELGLEPNHEASCSARAMTTPKPGCCQSSVGELSLVCLLFFRRPRRRVESVAHR